ncbi:MAG: hypothetical protein Q8L54_01750 [Devosia sp.]|nr:hypothetical protein [Devosia sp.]
MTMPSELEVAVVAPVEANQGSYVDWPAIIAGVVLASAIALVLLTFGSAVGLGFTNFHAPTGVAPVWIAIAAGSWLLWVQVSSFMSGAYLTGRLRKRHPEATEHEVDVRDGAHGLLVWGGALVVGAIIAAGGVGAAASAIGSAAATLTNAASNVAGEALDPNAYFVDTLFRQAPAATSPAAAPAAPAMGAIAPKADTAAVRSEAGRIFAQSVMTGAVSADDKAYLAQLVAGTTGLSEADATARLEQVMAAMEQVRADAATAAENARKIGVVAAFLTAASLLVSAAGAYWAAQKGGNHRDEGTVFATVFRRY